MVALGLALWTLAAFPAWSWAGDQLHSAFAAYPLFSPEPARGWEAACAGLGRWARGKNPSNDLEQLKWNQIDFKAAKSLEIMSPIIQQIKDPEQARLLRDRLSRMSGLRQDERDEVIRQLQAAREAASPAVERAVKDMLKAHVLSRPKAASITGLKESIDTLSQIRNDLTQLEAYGGDAIKTSRDEVEARLRSGRHELLMRLMAGGAADLSADERGGITPQGVRASAGFSPDIQPHPLVQRQLQRYDELDAFVAENRARLTSLKGVKDVQARMDFARPHNDNLAGFVFLLVTLEDGADIGTVRQALRETFPLLDRFEIEARAPHAVEPAAEAAAPRTPPRRLEPDAHWLSLDRPSVPDLDFAPSVPEQHRNMLSHVWQLQHSVVEQFIDSQWSISLAVSAPRFRANSSRVVISEGGRSRRIRYSLSFMDGGEELLPLIATVDLRDQTLQLLPSANPAERDEADRARLQ